ncbi:MAG: glycine cleavage system protein [Clostridiales bacterium]|jgi:glycine cleavage system H protein|nr:glycine cleavage system protein [Clostridiales bacterium]
MNVLQELYYTKDHEWIKVDGTIGYVGITDFAQHALGDIVYVEFPEVDDTLEANDTFGTIESVKAASDLMLPVGGTVVEVNEALEDDPGLVNSDPYENWIIKIEISDPEELKTLLDAKAYEAFCEEEE